MDKIVCPITEDYVETLLTSYVSSPVVKKLNDYFGEKSFLEILKVERKEIYHSNFLKWLFEDKETCKQAVHSLLVLLLRRSRQQKSDFPDWLKKALLTNILITSQVSVKSEDGIVDDSAKGRGDLLIIITYSLGDNNSKTLYVFIENKVGSNEHNVGASNTPQTEAYYNYYSKTYGKDNVVFVYLTPISSIILNNLSSPQCACKSFIHINYQDLLDNILTKLTHEESISEKKKYYIKEYIKGLSTNFTQNNSIMAMEPDLRNLLITFWNNNHELIEKSIEALSQDPNLEYDQIQSIQNASKSIKDFTKKRDTTKYSINNSGKYGKNIIVYEMVMKYLESINYGISLSELQNVFSYTWRGVKDSLSNKVIIGHEQYNSEVSDKSKWRWTKIEKPINDEVYVYVNNQWGGVDEMKKIIEKINNIQGLEEIKIQPLP